jgi:hypothetical protein
VLNDADVSAPRWKHEWLEPTAEFCSVHHTLLETVPASVFRLSGHFASALRAISRYREMRKFKGTDTISTSMDVISRIYGLQQQKQQKQQIFSMVSAACELRVTLHFQEK